MGGGFTDELSVHIVPDSCTTIQGGGDEQTAIGTKLGADDFASMTQRYPEVVPGFGVPHARGLVIGRSDNTLAVWTESNGADGGIVSHCVGENTSGGGFPNPGCMIF